MEEQREDKIGSVLAWLQASARGKASRMQFQKLKEQKLALFCVQRAIRAMMIAKTWKWMQIWLLIKWVPNMQTSSISLKTPPDPRPNLKCNQMTQYMLSPTKKVHLKSPQAEPEVHPVCKI